MKHKTSALILSVVTLLFALALLGLLVFAPRIATWYVALRGMPAQIYTAILAAFYTCAVPAALALACLLLLLRNIRQEQLFSHPNSTLMGVVSWCCAAVAAITLAAGFYYMPFFLLAAVMLFLFLVVRVVRSCFVAALALKEENSLTI